MKKLLGTAEFVHAFELHIFITYQVMPCGNCHVKLKSETKAECGYLFMIFSASALKYLLKNCLRGNYDFSNFY